MAVLTTIIRSAGFRHRYLSETRIAVCLILSPVFVLWRRHRAGVEYFALPPEEFFRLLEQIERRPRDGLEDAHLLHLRFLERAADLLAHLGASLPVDHRHGDIVEPFVGEI